MKLLLVLVIFANFLFSVTFKILNLEPNSTIKINSKVYKVDSNKFEIDLKEGDYTIQISHLDFIPLTFDYEVANDKKNIVILNYKENGKVKYPFIKRKDFFKTVEIDYKVRKGFLKVKRKDYCQTFKCEATKKTSLINIFSIKKVNTYKNTSNLYILKQDNKYSYFTVSVDSPYTYSTSETTNFNEDDKIVLSPVSSWSMFTLESGAVSYNDDRNYTGIVVGLGYRKNLPINIFVSLRTRYLLFFNKETNETLKGYQLGGGIGYLASNGLMLEGGILKNHIKNKYIENNKVEPYGEIAYRGLRLHYSPSTTEINYVNVYPFYFIYSFRFLGLSAVSKNVYENTDSSGLLFGLKVSSPGWLYSSFQYNYITTWAPDDSEAEKDELHGQSYGVGLGVRLFRMFFFEGGIMKYDLDYKYRYNGWEGNINIDRKIDDTNYYYEVGISGSYSKMLSISWLHTPYYDSLVFAFNIAF